MWPEIESWDLWCVYVPNQTSFKGWEIILDTRPYTGITYTKEYRIYDRVFKRDLDYIGTRTQKGI